MIITKRWLLANRTRRGSWNARQLKLLGIAWQPPRGWQKAVVGGVISAEVKEQFEALAGELARKR